ncbi:MAG TPA: hypothetical protein VF250_08110 [Conexibacter sp.]
MFLPAVASAARHYEKVSPVDKGQGDIVGDGVTTIAAVAGDAVTFNSRTPFGDTVGSGVSGQTQYVARRTETGWVTRAVTPTPRPDAAQTFFVPTRVQLFSDDLRTAVVWAYDLPAVSNDTPLRNNIYVEDTDARGLEPVTVSQVGPYPFNNFLATSIWGISADARHLAFVSNWPFLPDAAPGVPNVYQWDDGVLSLAGILPDRSVPATGSNVVPSLYRGTMSEDGTRLLFTASEGGNSQLYMRIGGSRTVKVSESELDPRADPTSVQLVAVTPDGHNVFFATDTPLVAEDGNSGLDLYRYTESANPSGDTNLTLITDNGGFSNGEVVGMSDDGDRVYYYPINSDTVSVWDHGVTHVVSGAVSTRVQPEFHLGVNGGWGPGLGRVTPDGRYMAFSVESFSGVDMLGNVTNGHFEVYLYSLDDETLVCVSCPARREATSDATVVPQVTSGQPFIVNVGSRPRFLSDRGHVFFSTDEALVPEDRNGVLDAYEYDPTSGRVSLLSTGKGSDPTSFADASASGDDVFVVTRQHLVKSDQDDFVDMYDAREGSTLIETPEETRPICEGETCQPPPSKDPLEDPLGTLGFDEGDTPPIASKLLAVRQRLLVHGPSGALRVRLFVAGRISWSGKGLRSGSIRGSRAGTYALTLRLGRHARAHLRAFGTYVTSVQVTFASTDGDRTKRTTRVTFKLSTKKGR